MIGRQANADKTKDKFISRKQNAGPYNNVNVVNKPFKNASNFKHWACNIQRIPTTMTTHDTESFSLNSPPIC